MLDWHALTRFMRLAGGQDLVMGSPLCLAATVCSSGPTTASHAPALFCAGQGAAAGGGEAAELLHAGVPRRLGVLARCQHGQLPHGAAEPTRAVRQRRRAAVERIPQARPLVLIMREQLLLTASPWCCVRATRTCGSNCALEIVFALAGGCCGLWYLLVPAVLTW